MLVAETCTRVLSGSQLAGQGGEDLGLDYPAFSLPSFESFLSAGFPAQDRVDMVYLIEVVGLSEKNAAALLAGLRKLGFVGEDGVLSGDGRLVLEGGEGRAAAFGRALVRVYGRMLDALLVNEEFDLDQVHRFLEAGGNLKLKGRQQVAFVFKYLLLNGDREDLKRRFSQKKCFAS